MLIRRTVGATEDLLQLDGRACGDIHLRATGDTLLVTTTIDGIDLTTGKVDDCRSRVGVSNDGSRVDSHTHTASLTGTEELSTLKGSHGLRDIHENVTAVLHLVLLLLTRVTLSCSIDEVDDIAAIVGGSEVDKRIVQPRLKITISCRSLILVISTFSISVIEILTIVIVRIVIHTIAATIDLFHATLLILHVSGCIQHVRIRHLTDGVVTAILSGTDTI